MKRMYAIGILPYTILLLYMMFFASGRNDLTIGFIQLNPFQTIRHFLMDDVELTGSVVNLLGNIFLFSPFGFLGIKYKTFNHIGKLTAFFMLTIICIELTQYYTARGTADIDDIFLNTIGMMLGYRVYIYLKLRSVHFYDLRFLYINKKLFLEGIKS